MYFLNKHRGIPGYKLSAWSDAWSEACTSSNFVKIKQTLHKFSTYTHTYI